MENIPARQARIFWTPGEGVDISPVGAPAEFMHHRKSGGACWGFWREQSTEALYFRLMQQIVHLVIRDKVPPDRVHEAFKAVPEYRATLPPGHPDALRDDEEDLLEGMPDFGEGYVHFA